MDQCFGIAKSTMVSRVLVSESIRTRREPPNCAPVQDRIKTGALVLCRLVHQFPGCGNVGTYIRYNYRIATLGINLPGVSQHFMVTKSE